MHIGITYRFVIPTDDVGNRYNGVHDHIWQSPNKSTKNPTLWTIYCDGGVLSLFGNYIVGITENDRIEVLRNYRFLWFIKLRSLRCRTYRPNYAYYVDRPRVRIIKRRILKEFIKHGYLVPMELHELLSEDFGII